MSSVIVVAAPLVVASWPLVSAAITAAVGTMGFASAQNLQRACTSCRRLIPKTAPRSSSMIAKSSLAQARRANKWLSNATASVPSSAATPGRAEAVRGRTRANQGRVETDRRGPGRPRHPAVCLPPAGQRAQRAANDDSSGTSRRGPGDPHQGSVWLNPAERKGEMSR